MYSNIRKKETPLNLTAARIVVNTYEVRNRYLKGDNEVKPGAMHKFPDICLVAEGKPRKLDKYCATSPRLK